MHSDDPNNAPQRELGNEPQDGPWDASDPLWQTLGQAPLAQPAVSFAADTLARCLAEGRPLEVVVPAVRTHAERNVSPQHDLQNDPLPTNDSLWQTLGQAPLPESPAWFTAHTLARIRQEGRGVNLVEAIRENLAGIWRWTVAGGLAATMAVALVMAHPQTVAPVAHQPTVQDAFEVVAAMPDNDSDSSSSSSSSSTSWQDSSL